MRQNKALPWIIGMLLATLLFAALLLTTNFRYIGSDDVPILRSFMGYEGGVPARFNMILHTVFAWLLYGLALLFPGVAWFSVLQLFLLWLSCAVIGKSCIQAARVLPRSSAGLSKRNSTPLALLAGLAAPLIFLLVFGAYVLCRVSYTTTAALLGAAAVAQLLSVDIHARPGQLLRAMGFSIALLLCSYCLRQISVLPSLVFWALGLCGKLLSCGRSSKEAREEEPPAAEGEGGSVARRPRARSTIKPLLYGALLCALCFGAFAGLRAAEISSLGLRDFLDWQEARSRLLDYSSFNPEQSPEIFEKLGWSPAKVKLVTQWFFMDSDITTEAFRTLYAIQPEASYTFSDRLAGIPGIIDSFGRSEPPSRYACWALLAFWVFALLAPPARGQPSGRGGRAAGWQKGTILLALPLGAVMLLYLAYQGRLPPRAAASVLFPLGAFLCLGLSPWAHCPTERDALPDSSRAPASPRKQLTDTPSPTHGLEARPPQTRRGAGALALAGCRIAALAVCLVLCGLSVDATAQRLLARLNPEAEASSVTPDQLDEFALENPDVIIIYDLALVADGRLFPDTSNGIPGNVLFWGGWPARSPSWLYQLAQYGIDGNAFTAHDFLRENLVLASTGGEPMQSLVTYVSESAGPVDWEVYSMYGYINTFQLYEEEPWEDFEDAGDTEDLAKISFPHS